MPANDQSEQVEVTSRAELRAWLEANHTRRDSIWVVTYKESAGQRHVPYDTVAEEALCFGWIDSTPRRLDEKRSMRRLSPRKPGSGWSAINKARIERLIAENRMTPAGLARIEAAKADGSWSLLDVVEILAVPDDLAAALANHPPAAIHFEAFPKSVKRSILEWINQARKPETRTRRVTETASLAAENKRANQYTRKP